MDTPEIFYENLSKGIITYEMLDLALFSLNKRAKNYRDQKRMKRVPLSCRLIVTPSSNMTVVLEGIYRGNCRL